MPTSSCRADHVGHRGVGLPRERGRVHRLAPVAADEHVAQHGRAGKAAHVGGEDAPVAALHDPAGPRSSFWRRVVRSLQSRARVPDTVGSDALTIFMVSTSFERAWVGGRSASRPGE